MTHGLALIQQGLASLGYSPGQADGIDGPRTRKAIAEAQANGWKPKTVADKPLDKIGAWPRQSDVAAFFGPAGHADCTGGRVHLPMPFYLAWDKGAVIKSFSCHVKVATPLTSIFAETFAHYGATRMAELALNCFGGCYNYRKMRGGSSLSMHAWGIAVDLDPERNQLAWGRDKAEFAKPEYDAFWEIVEAHGAKSLGRSANMDFQHFQFTA